MDPRGMEFERLLERHSAELKASHEQFRTILLQNPDAILIVNEAGRIRLANAPACRLFDRDDAELRDYEIGLPLVREEAVEVEVRQRDGSIRLVELRVTPVTWEDAPAQVAWLRDVTPRRELEERLRSLLAAGSGAEVTPNAQAEALRALTARLQVARERERALTAHEIHDMAQVLAALDLHLAATATQLLKELDPTAALGSLEETSRLLCSTVEASARICLQLRPSLLDNLGLAPAIEWHARQFALRTGISIAHGLLDQTAVDHPDVRIAVFRIFEHILSNVERHAGASRVHIDVEHTGASLVIEVCDDGRGITADEIAAPTSLGIMEMRELTHLFGGELSIEGTRENGTAVRLNIPVNARILSAAAHEPIANPWR